MFRSSGLIMAVASTTLLVASCASAGPSRKLQPPFAAPAARASAKDKPDCEEPPAPVVSLNTTSRYVQDDPTKSTVDKEREAAYEETMAPLRSFTKGLAKLANTYEDSGGKNKSAAICAMRWLSVWAEADALSDMRSGTAEFNRAGALSAISFAYMQVSQFKISGRDPRKKIKKWIYSTAEKSRFYFSSLPKDRGSNNNNHRYWAGLGVAAAGIVVNSRSLFSWGIDSYKVGVCQVTPEGVLPLELKRGKRAVSYHAFATAPLVTLAALSDRNGESVDGECDNGLERLVKFTLSAIDDPRIVEQMTGIEQEPLSQTAKFDPADVAWLEYLENREPLQNPWHDRMNELRPMLSTGLGGNLTQLLAQPAD